MKEAIEHAYNSTRRLRLRLSALAKLSSESSPQNGRAEAVALEAIVALDVAVCAIHQFTGEKKLEVLAFHKSDELDEAKIKLAATHLATEVASLRDVVALTNLSARHAAGNWLNGTGLQNYLGIPLFNPKKEVIGVAGLFSSATREFSQEDEWWLRTASQLVADELAYRQLEAKANELERSLMCKTEVAPDGTINKNGAKSKFSVLVVDDDRAINDLICEFLSLEDYHVEAAFDGLEAISRFRPSEHDVVITDVAMPLMNGWELIAALRVRAPELPVLLMTGYGSGNWNENYLKKQGVHAVFSKPLDLGLLTDTLEGIKAKL
jgi:CheY-like chemotaxis protein